MISKINSKDYIGVTKTRHFICKAEVAPTAICESELRKIYEKISDQN